MKCEECLKVIEDYFDGELDGHAASRVSEHLMSCEACSRALEELDDEQNLYALYRREVEVSPALWTGVAARIREEQAQRSEQPAMGWLKRLAELFGTPRLSPAVAFALLILAVGATAGLMKYMQSQTVPTESIAQKQPEKPAPSTPAAVSSPADSRDNTVRPDYEESVDGETDGKQQARQNEENDYKAPPALKTADNWAGKRVVIMSEGYNRDLPDQLVREAEQKYVAAIALLSRDAKRRRTLLEPDMRARFDQTLAAVDRTISETRRAARRQPDDPVAVQYMLAAYAKKVEVLKEMAVYRVDERDMQ